MGPQNKIRFRFREVLIEFSGSCADPTTLKRFAIKSLSLIGAGLPLLLAYLTPMRSTSSPPGGERATTGSFATRLGEHRCEPLPDGSRVCLNTNTMIRYLFNQGTRNVEIVSGEASFVVRNDGGRPFDVLSGGVLIHDLSTSFDVYKKRHSTQVTVIDGHVRVIAPVTNELRLKFDLAQAEDAWKTAPELHRFQQIEFDEATRSIKTRSSMSEQRLSQLLAWQQGRIDLNGRALSEALVEFSRYQPIAKFNYADKSIGRIVVGGNMEFANLHDFLQALQREFDVHHAITGADVDTVVTLSRPQKHSRTE